MATRNSATPTGQLGLISCKFGANPAADRPASFRNVCTGVGTTVAHPIAATQQGSLKCPVCSGPPNGKAREVSKGSFVEVDQADLDAAAEEAKAFKGTFSINPHPAEQMTQMLPAPDGKVYVLHPYDASQADTYQLLLHEVRSHPELCFTTVWTVSTVPAMYRLQEYRDRLILVELAWPSAIRDLPEAGGTLNPALVTMADAFVQTLVTDFDPSTYKDTGRERLEQIIAASTPVSTGTGTSVAPQGVSDLMAELQKAVAAAGVTPPPASTPAKKAKKAKVSA